jgi:hypothetical protein
MKDAGADSGEGQGLVISDNDRLARAIALVLDHCLGVEMVELGPDSLREWKTPQDVDLLLIVLALSSADSEPFVLLSKASLGATIGQVPILIVSERAFSSDPGNNVIHMDFPYNPQTLCDRASEIVRKESAIGQAMSSRKRAMASTTEPARS